ncbi:crotonase/enoyl-CoA hydratase family protein [Mesorhizobium sp. M0118]|uniref:crotonase/enoyl-CoA hydratase family protein n=1 Tax=Mesorhizobium sp. M0118 TaxID=2956884 RepID=UPI003336CE56
MNKGSHLVMTDCRSKVLIITINRPEVRNAFDLETAKAMQAAMDFLDDDESLLLGIVTGAGGNFSSGMDLKAAARDGPVPALARGDFGILGRPARKPLIAAVEGYAVAGGFEISLACDLIVAARDAKFGLPEVRHNLLATYALLRLPLRMPYHLAMELALTGAFKGAPFFERFGVVNVLTEPGKALDEALKLADILLANGPLALAASKEIIFQSLDRRGQEDRLKQSTIVQRVINSDDLREGLRAFAENREPIWKGR